MNQMTIHDLISQLNQIVRENGRDDFPVHVIFDGECDITPTVNVADGIVYIEGVSANHL